MGQSKPYALCLARRPMLALMDRQKRSRQRPWRDGDKRGPIEPGKQGSRTDSLLAVSSSTSPRTGDQAWRWANLFSVKLRFVGESNICFVFLRRAGRGLIGQGLQGKGPHLGLGRVSVRCVLTISQRTCRNLLVPSGRSSLMLRLTRDFALTMTDKERINIRRLPSNGRRRAGLTPFLSAHGHSSLHLPQHKPKPHLISTRWMLYVLLWLLFLAREGASCQKPPLR